MEDHSQAWLARAAALEREAQTFRHMAATDDDAGRYDLAARNRRAAADKDVEARVLRECVRELERSAVEPVSGPWVMP